MSDRTDSHGNNVKRGKFSPLTKKIHTHTHTLTHTHIYIYTPYKVLF